ncbi:TetR family transcriptional regulator [Agrobacterium rubi]|uniref:TetR family transcriptional regulator C-terminal domain-containing protein n=1 Tax=Agrobacterium rubi TaxID=28099 RepID=UPI001574A783|nr:TetR family transcriptional regulator C-terminal domain-containing protein [Agrobacterium rubi]MCL6654717.1 TetR family transcriptional regulator [Agrobacterium rubi]NTF09107.1 TetR family transcriptional regulator [Agrobacterium rubi]NTF21377.1 TetR family transcriptional regulator [Agrobacterium rubi]NTF28234.1 TetR family transcriptional regulator [Agrobacterium rubi]
MARTGKGIQKQNREDNIAKILKAAEQVFAELGFVGASISRIADRAGLPKSNIVYYFETKERLYKYVVRDIFNVWRVAAERLDAEDDPAIAIAAYVDIKMDLARSRPDGSKVWANEIIQGGPYVQDYLETELRSWTEDREAVMNIWIEKGKMRPMKPKHLLYAIWATTQHYADFRHQITTLNGNQEYSDQQWAEAKRDLTNILLRGVLP